MATTFTVGSGDIMVPWGKSRLKSYPVHVSQTIYAGAVVSLSTADGYENRIVAAGDTTTSGIVGVAAEAITTTATHNAATDHILVYCADPDAFFAARTVSDTAIDFTTLGTRLELELDTSNHITVVQLDGTTYETVMAIEYRNPTDRNVQATQGDTSALAIVKFLPGASIFIPTVLA